MSNSSTTVRDVFELPKAGTEGSSTWKNFRDRAAKQVKEIKTAALPDVADKVAELLEIPLPDIFIASWKKTESIKALLEESRQTPEIVINTELGDHTINSEHRPHIEVRIQNKAIRKIEFKLKLSFHLKGFVLKIRDGEVRGMQTGTCEAKGRLEYEGLVIAEKKLAPITLPGMLSFGEVKSTETTPAFAAKDIAKVAAARAASASAHAGPDVEDAGSFIPPSALATDAKTDVDPAVIKSPKSAPILDTANLAASLTRAIGGESPATPMATEAKVEAEPPPAVEVPPANPAKNEVIEPAEPAAIETSPVIEKTDGQAEDRDTWEVEDVEETPAPVHATNNSAPGASAESDDAQNILDQMSRELSGRRQAGE